MQPWRLLASRPLFERSPWLRLWEDDVELPNGEKICGYLRTDARDYAMTFAVRRDGLVPLVRQYKHGIGESSYDLPAGYLDSPEEPPLAAAQRELREETGLTAPHWRSLGHLIIDTNRGHTRAHIYLALDAERTSEQELDATEALVVSYHEPSELKVMALQGEIDSMASVAGIMTALQVLDSAS